MNRGFHAGFTACRRLLPLWLSSAPRTTTLMEEKLKKTQKEKRAPCRCQQTKHESQFTCIKSRFQCSAEVFVQINFNSYNLNASWSLSGLWSNDGCQLQPFLCRPWVPEKWLLVSRKIVSYGMYRRGKSGQNRAALRCMHKRRSWRSSLSREFSPLQECQLQPQRDWHSSIKFMEVSQSTWTENEESPSFPVLLGLRLASFVEE